MSEINTIKDLIDCAALPAILPDQGMEEEILSKTPEPRFLSNPRPNSTRHQHTNAPYLVSTNPNINPTPISKNISYHSPSPPINKQIIVESEYNIDIDDSMIIPRINLYPNSIPSKRNVISIELDNPTTNVTTLIDSRETPTREYMETPSQSKQLLKMDSKNSINSREGVVSSRRLNPYQAHDYQQKLNELNYKINQIITINQSLETRIEQTTEQMESKADENKRLNKKCLELTQRVKQQSLNYQQLEQIFQQHRNDSNATLNELKKKSSSNINDLQLQILTQKTELEQLNKNQSHLVSSIQSKRRQLSQIKQFSSKIQRGILEMRL